MTDDKLKIKIFGVGGGGGHTIEKLSELVTENIELIALNTNARALLETHLNPPPLGGGLTPGYTTADSGVSNWRLKPPVVDTKAPKKILIGKKLTGGASIGSDITIGDKCARHDIGQIAEAVDDADVVFITCGLGGGTGSGAAPVIAERAQKAGALTIAIVTLPFPSEGRKKITNAETGLKNLKQNSDAVIVIPNEKLLKLAPWLPITEAFKLADETTAKIVKELSSLVGDGSLTRLSMADVRSVLSGGRTVYVGVGESENFLESANAALNSPLIDADVLNCCGALVNVTFGEHVDERRVEETLKYLSSHLPSSTNILWASRADGSLPKNTIKTLLVLCQSK